MPSSILVTPTHYVRDGVSYDRVTEVIGATWPQPDLQDWRATVGKARANRELRHGEHVGTLVDVAITNYILGTPLKTHLSVEVRQALRGFTEWRALNPFTPLACQCPLLDQKRRLGGTPDCLGLTEGFDWKTSARFSFPHLLQIDQYWRLAESHGYTLKRYRLVRFDKILGTWEERILTLDGMEWEGVWVTRSFLAETFVALLTIYRHWRYMTGQAQNVALSSTVTSTKTA